MLGTAAARRSSRPMKVEYLGIVRSWHAGLLIRMQGNRFALRMLSKCLMGMLQSMTIPLRKLRQSLESA